MADDFTKYEAMRRDGAMPEDVYRAAKEDGVDTITRIRLIRAVYSPFSGRRGGSDGAGRASGGFA